MEIKRAEFIKSFGTAEDYSGMNMPEIAIAGRSNVGKSSFINMLSKNKKLAYVSVTPGKTKLINVFRINDNFLLMDLPGYGYAHVSDADKKRFAGLIEGYFHKSEQLKNVFVLLDIRHQLTSDDLQMLSWLYAYSVPFTVIATKSDKIPKYKKKAQVEMLARECGIVPNMIIPVSSQSGEGRAQVLSRLGEILG
ncbi:MAG TPA: ribosome biogenesis GTP-binding protein YihA/YsxC [Clostridia bacterium]|nr:ribosome biogenesis GTP-binding protein YihA/YsxC [Clostridia bacterium]